MDWYELGRKHGFKTTKSLRKVSSYCAATATFLVAMDIISDILKWGER